MSASASGVDAGEIHSPSSQPARAQIVRVELLPEEQAISLPAPVAAPGPIAPLTRLLGPLLTVANPAWSGDPLPRFRALQKCLVEHALGLEPDQRGACMEAMVVVESAVRLRLRLQQMRASDAEQQLYPQGSKET
ncbi:hypothetical protein HSX11_09395 [Oxalobacteraceae bacterium]|nr:hypothetical protein [Oxalobacteraceae bacterium]